MIEYNEENVVLVDNNDNKIGTCEKMKAHLEGRLHRAFSVFIFNSRKEVLLQKRAATKYHSGGLWTNACCSHPCDFESIENAAHRRLMDELGLDCEIKKVFGFYYNVKLENNMYEHEYDHVFIGKYDGVLKPNPDEVDSCMWINKEELIHKIAQYPNQFTFWFKYLINDALNCID